MRKKYIYLLSFSLIFLSFCKKNIKEIETIPQTPVRKKIKKKDFGKTEIKKTLLTKEKETELKKESKEEKNLLPEPEQSENQEQNNISDTYEIGIASWYGENFHGRPTASGEVFDKNDISAAHKTLPLGTIVKVKNLENGKEIIVKINDRGPFVKGRIIDLSEEAAKKLGFRNKGTAKVSISIIKKPTDNKINFNKITKKEYNKTRLYYIQAGAFKIRENAENILVKLKNIIPSANFHIIRYKNLNIVVSRMINSHKKIAEYIKILNFNDIEYIIKKRIN